MIKSLYVSKFRAMEDMLFPIGQKVTVIAGQNATCKSTILGMLGQPFGIKNEKSIFNKPFSTKFSDIFKFSKVNDIPGKHEYRINFCDENPFGKPSENVKSFKRSEKDASHIRFVTGKTRGKGEGNLDYPVIYLGLKRTYPLGELGEINEVKHSLGEEEEALYNEWYKKIFFPQEEIAPVQLTSGSQKDTLAVNSKEYDYYANSAGQDNLGQILGSILSFMRLKKKLGPRYYGGLILIDELDATLFPAAQTNLIDLFYNLAGKLNLQFIFTTHSLDALSHIIDKRKHNKGDTEVLYFTNVYGKLDLIVNPEMERIRADLNMETIPSKRIEKINVYCEDKEASWFIKRLLGPSKSKLVAINDSTFGGEELKSLARKNIPEFKNSILVLDGDVSRANATPNILFLPGDISPERLFCEFLRSLPPSDSFWSNDRGYTKQVFEKNLSDITNGRYEDREKMKKWFNNEKACWGRGAGKLFKSWEESNQSLVESFNQDFKTVFNSIAKRKSIPML